MGNCCLPFRLSRRSSAVNPKNVTLLLVGLDNSGKTTIVKRLSGEPLDTVVPTVGFSVVSLQQKGCKVSIYDLGGGPQIRDIWPRYYADAHGVIFVVDANDTQRMDESRKVLEDLLKHDQISGKPVLLLANKQDLEGALDEIDIVDRLNVEQLVNKQKCPTLVELCSARHLTKKTDIGIDNGYKWLIRCIVKDYPSLNNRVLRDLAKQQDEYNVQLAKRKARVQKIREERGDLNEIQSYDDFAGDPFKPIQEIVEEQPYRNGIIKHIESMDELQRTMANLPGQTDDLSENEIPNNVPKRKGSFTKTAGSSRESFSYKFFKNERIESEAELLESVASQEVKNFLVRPKSSGAKLYGNKSDSDIKKLRKRKKLKKVNKTGPSPFTDLSSEQNGPLPKIFDPAYHTEVEIIENHEENHKEIASTEIDDKADDDDLIMKKNPFVVSNRDRRRSITEAFTTNPIKVDVVPSSKSMPSSRINSGNNFGKRRYSILNDTGVEVSSRIGKLPPLKIPSSNNLEVLLDVTQLDANNL